MLYTCPQESPPGSAGAEEPVLSLAEDRVLRSIMNRDVVISDDLVVDLLLFVRPNDTVKAIDRLSRLGLVEIKSASRFIGGHDISPRCVMITQKGHDYTRRMRAQDGRGFTALVSLLPAGLLVLLIDLVIPAGLQVGFMDVVGFGMTAIGAAGLAGRKIVRIVKGRN